MSADPSPCTTAQAPNLISWIEAAATQLEHAGCAFGHGTTNAFDEAAWLALWQLKLPLNALEAEQARRFSKSELAGLEALLRQRIQSRKPTAYLTGEAWLHGVPFFIDERSIVPRSLVAEPMLDGSLDAWLADEPQRVLDLCTGNGSLAVLAALQWPQAQVLGTDLSAAALELATRNVQRHGLQQRIELRQGDGLAPLSPDTAKGWKAAGAFDLIVCNPPYVNSRSMQALPAEFKAEPALALDGGEDGMRFIAQVLPQLAQHLAPQGVLVLEIGHEIEHFVRAFQSQAANRLAAIGLPTSAGDEQVLLIEAQALKQWAQTKRPAASRSAPNT